MRRAAPRRARWRARAARSCCARRSAACSVRRASAGSCASVCDAATGQTRCCEWCLPPRSRPRAARTRRNAAARPRLSLEERLPSRASRMHPSPARIPAPRRALCAPGGMIRWVHTCVCVESPRRAAQGRREGTPRCSPRPWSVRDRRLPPPSAAAGAARRGATAGSCARPRIDGASGSPVEGRAHGGGALATVLRGPRPLLQRCRAVSDPTFRRTFLHVLKGLGLGPMVLRVGRNSD